MPQAILRPNRDGAVQAWTPSGAATAWQALRDGLASSYVFAQTAGQRLLVGFDSLPVDAATVSLVSILAPIAGDGAGSLRMTSRLAAADRFEGAAFMPPDSGSAFYRFDLATAPDGSAWTVAKANAFLAGPDTTTDFGSPFAICEQLALAVDYEAATPVADPHPETFLELESAGPVALALGPSRTALELESARPVPLEIGR